MEIVNLELLKTKQEELRTKMMDKHSVYFNKPNGKFMICFPAKSEISIESLNEIQVFAKRFYELETLKIQFQNLDKFEV